MSTVVREGPWRKPGVLESALLFDGLTVEMKGFQRYSLRDVSIQVDARRRQDVTMSVGDVTQEVTVAATAQQANEAPISWPSCCRAGVAPTSQPVFRS